MSYCPVNIQYRYLILVILTFGDRENPRDFEFMDTKRFWSQKVLTSVLNKVGASPMRISSKKKDATYTRTNRKSRVRLQGGL